MCVCYVLTLQASSFAGKETPSFHKARFSKIYFSESPRKWFLSLAIPMKFTDNDFIYLCISPVTTSIDVFPSISSTLFGQLGSNSFLSFITTYIENSNYINKQPLNSDLTVVKKTYLENSNLGISLEYHLPYMIYIY